MPILTRPEWIAPQPAIEQPRLHPDPLLHALLARRAPSPLLAEAFLDARPRGAPDPLGVPGMAAGVERIVRALRSGEAIGLFGDYDTDGVTSSALLTLALRAASGGAQPVAVRLPLRAEGYGFSVAGVDDLAAAGAKLLIAVDCGSKDHAAVERAHDLGMDVVIVDHHRIDSDVPRGAIVVTAQLEEDSRYRSISAAGLAYLLATALAGEGMDTGAGRGHEPVGLLDLAMIGLVGDVSSLVGVNRPLVRDGLRQLRNGPRPGLQAMGEMGSIDFSRITSGDVAFQVSPRLNAPGRLGDPRPAYDLLIATSQGEATRRAGEMERANQERRNYQNRVLREIHEEIAASPDLLQRRILLFTGADWEPGIVGLAASKLAEEFDRPVIVMTVADGIAHGSARSVPGFDITEGLTACADLITRHGGHERAAGLSMSANRVPELDAALQVAIARSTAPPPGPPRLEIEADLEPDRLQLGTWKLLQQLAPFGEGNPVPLLRIVGAPLRDYLVMGRERQHLKLRIGQGAGSVDAVLWSGAARSRELIGARAVDLVGVLEENHWNGSTRLQVKLSDFRVAEG